MKQVKGMAAAKVGTARRGVVTGWRKDGLHGDRRGLVAEVSMLALAASGALFSASPATAQVTPAAPECTIVGQAVTCQGNLSAGVTVTPQDTYDTLIIENLSASIAPVAGTIGVEFVNGTTDINITTRASAFGISTNGDEAHGIAASVGIGSALNISNALNVETNGKEAAAIQAFGNYVLTESDNDISVTNFGILTTRQEQSNAIHIGGTDLRNVIVRNYGEINTISNFSDGIYISPGLILTNKSYIDVENYNTITTSGNYATGILIGIGAVEPDILLKNEGDIDSGGYGGRGILVWRAEHVNGTNAGNITVSGDYGVGIELDLYKLGASTSTFLNTGDILVTGEGSTGAFFSGSAAYTNTGEIRSEGKNGQAAVVAAQSAGASEITFSNVGIISSIGDWTYTSPGSSLALSVSGWDGSGTGSTIQFENAGEVKASGAGTNGVLLEAFAVPTHALPSVMTINTSGDISATGDGAFAIMASQNGGPAIIDAVIEIGALAVVAGGAGVGGGINLGQALSGSIANGGTITAASGVAIVGSAGGDTVTNSGSIVGSVSLGGGADTMELLAVAGQSVTGLIDGQGGTDHFRFSGAGTASFGMGNVAGFETFEKTGASTWTLTGASAGTATFVHNQGGLVLNATLPNMAMTVAGGATLGGTGTLASLTVANNGIIAPGNSAGTLRVGSLALNANSVLNFELGAPNVVGIGINDLIDVTGGLTLDGTVNVTAQPGFGNGLYTLIEYGTLVADNGLLLGTTPLGFTYTLNSGTGTASAVTLLVAGGAAGDVQFWDGANTTPGNIANGRGGTGAWGSGTNWTNAAGSANAAWGDEFAIFGGAAGTVSVVGEQTFTGMQFLTDGYHIFDGSLGARLEAVAAGATISLGTGIGAEIGTTFIGGPITKTGAGVLRVGGRIVDDIGAVKTWTVEGGELVIDGGFRAGSWENNTAAILRNGSTLTVTEDGSIGRTGGNIFNSADIEIADQGHVILQENGTISGTIFGTASNSTVTIGGDIAASAAVADVVRLAGDDNALVLLSSGKITEIRSRSVGLSLTGNRSRIHVAGSITSVGDAATAIYNSGNSGEITVDGTVAMTGSGRSGASNFSSGIRLSGNSNLLVINGSVSTTGEYMAAVTTSGTDNHIKVAGSIMTTADFVDPGGLNFLPHAIMMSGSNSLEVSGTLSTEGIGIPTVVLQGGTSNMTLSGTVQAANATETAILFDGGSPSSSNTLELQPGYAITGLVIGDVDAAVNDLVFGGVGGSATFNVASIGNAAQFRNFDRFSKTGNSTWTLTGTNNDLDPAAPWAVEAGTLLVNAGMSKTSFTVAGGATLGGVGTLGSLTVADNGILAPGNSIGTLTVTGDVVLNDTSRLNYELGAAGTSGAPGSSDLLAVGGNLTLDGKLHLSDAGGAGIGHYRLMTYSGTLTDNTLDVMTPYPVSSATHTIQIGGGNVDLVIASTGGPVTGDPNLQYWQDNSATWTAAGSDWRNSGGDIDVAWAGNHGVFNGAGSTIAVTGTHSFKGLQFVTSGYTLDGAGTLQTVADGSELRVLGGETATIAATISGGGGITKTQGGTLILTGANTYAGATSIEAGTLALQGGGSIASGAALGFTGAGLFDVSGVAAGNTQIGTLSGVAGSKIALGATDLTINQGSNGTFAGVIEGTGDVEKSGIGVLTLTGNNTYTGTTTIAQGTLSLGDGGGSGSAAGNIVNNNNFLVFNRSNGVTYAGVLSGSGATSFIGSGMTTLTGNSGGLTGPVAVTAGNLRLASGASLGATTLTVGTGGALSGLGTVVGNVSVEGRLAPGADTLGTFTVTGNATFVPGSTYAIRIAGTDPLPSGQTVDSLNVDGTADLTGGAVEIAAIDPRTSYVDGHRYVTPILSATGGLGGTEFADVGMASASAFITPTLSYEGNDVFLTIAVTQDFTTAAGTFNQLQAANALNGLEQTGDALTVFNTIANMDEDNARRAFDLTSGEVHAAGQHVIDQTFALFNRTLRYQGVAGIGSGNVGAQVFTAPLGYGPAVTASSAGVAAIDDATDYADARVRGAWAAPLGGFGHVDADGNAAKLDWWNAGLAGGYEGVIDVASGTAVGGFGFGYIHSRGTVDARLSTFDSDGFYLGAYGAWADGPWNVAGSLSYGANRVSTTRNIAFMGTTAGANYWTHTIGLSGEASYAFDLADTTKLAPLFTLDAGWSGHGGFTETGAGALNLTSGSESWTRLDAGLGIALTHIILTETGKVTLEGRAVWEHAFSDVVPSQNLAFAGSPTGFTVLGSDAGRDRLRIGAGLSWDVSDDMTVRARYDGLFSGNQANHSASLGLNIRF